MQGDFQPVVTNVNATVRTGNLVYLLPPVFDKVYQEQKNKNQCWGAWWCVNPAAILA